MDFNDRMVKAAEDRMTLAEAVKIFKPLGLWISKRRDEYRVAFPNDEESAYYTTDLDDAVGTGLAMARARKE